MMTDRAFVSFSQNREDVVLARALQPDRRPGFWVDVGASDPFADSTTAAFAARGWCGVNVEPLEVSVGRLRDARPRDVNLQLALGAVPGSSKLFIGPPGQRGLSTLVPDVAERFPLMGGELEQVEVQVSTLGDVVAEHVAGPVDFLTIDVEGSEREVLEGADWSVFRPRVVVIDACLPGTAAPTHAAWEGLLIDAGYQFALFDGLNRFYARGDEPDLLDALCVAANITDDYVPASVVELEREVERLEPAVRQANAAARRARDEAAVANEMLIVLQEELTHAQLRAARALREREAYLDELNSLHATMLFRRTARVRKAYYRLRSLARWLGG